MAAATLALMWSATSGTQSAWTSGIVANPTNSGATGSLAFTHTYASTSCSLAARVTGTVSCGSGLAPTSAATAGGVSATDTTSNDGTLTAGSISSQFRATSCAPVALSNAQNGANPLMARDGMTFHGSGGPMDSAGYVTLDGQSPGGYGSAVVSQPQPPTGLLSAGRLSGVGVWFKAAPGSGGPLFSFAASGSNGAGNADRTVYLDAAGKVSAIWNTAGSAIGPSASSYADNAWHFAYLTFGGVSVAIIGLIPDVQLWVDGVNVASTPLISLSPLSSYGGYWHLGWAPTAVTGLASAYFSGSLAQLVVLNGGTPPTGATIGKPATVAAFITAVAGTVTERWPLDDTGTTTYGGSLPVIGATSPCTMVDLGWTTTGPADTIIAAGTKLSAFADGTWHTVAAPGAGGTQTGTLTLSRDATWNAYVAGLRLYAPLEHRLTAGSWTGTLSWAGSSAVFLS